jgi:hypothetical protein
MDFASSFGNNRFYVFRGMRDGAPLTSEHAIFELTMWDPPDWRRLSYTHDENAPQSSQFAIVPFEECILFIGGESKLEVLQFRGPKWWTPVQPAGIRPSVFHCRNAFAIAPGVALAFAGLKRMRVWLFRDYGAKMDMLKTRGCAPAGRTGQVMGRLGNHFIVFPDENHPAPAVFNLDTQEWSTPLLVCESERRSEWFLSDFAVCSGDNCCWVHGGTTGGRVRSALYRVEFRPAAQQTAKLPTYVFDEELARAEIDLEAPAATTMSE